MGFAGGFEAVQTDAFRIVDDRQALALRSADRHGGGADDLPDVGKNFS
ncbi:hypothetical protein [Arthrobacter sp.]|nr:hypothetical protein [Arthrobacter sp.]